MLTCMVLLDPFDAMRHVGKFLFSICSHLEREKSLRGAQYHAQGHRIFR